MKAITPKKAHQIANKIGIDIDDEEITFYATDEEESEIWSYGTKAERDKAIMKSEQDNIVVLHIDNMAMVECTTPERG